LKVTIVILSKETSHYGIIVVLQILGNFHLILCSVLGILKELSVAEKIDRFKKGKCMKELGINQ
jgi:hypothetical protein